MPYHNSCYKRQDHHHENYNGGYQPGVREHFLDLLEGPHQEARTETREATLISRPM